MRIIIALIFICLLWTPTQTEAQNDDTEKTPLEALSISGLKFRSLGPAFTSGRISDFAVHPEKPWEYYIATSSGGVWKTVNSGTTYTPIFDGQGSYSIGCITMDPSNPNTIWVGTGENNNQRSVGYGDGIYRSNDGGATWKHMGLKRSEHIGKIIVHPTNSDVIYVAAIGPLWAAGGERGVYKSTDGGANWKLALQISQHTGVTDLIMDPRNPDVLYAAAFQRRRHVFTYLGGGPESTIYKSTDGGESWDKSNNGLPKVDIGRIGLAISPADPEVIYAIVEAARDESGVYRSTDRGASWEKRGKFVTSGNYYQEIVADPVNASTLYAMDTWMSVSHDGGKTFALVGEDYKHVDNHCMWINPSNPQHWLVGCDGGIYETWDAAKTWHFKANLPVTQFYKVSVDNDFPFYNIYGGTQDNFTIGGPSRTITDHGINNGDWFITHGGDGFETQVDPTDPNIVYSQSQYGVLVRYDKKSGEEVGIQPKERKGENAYRWNWDAPLAVSHHQKGRLYFAANKLFRSNDRGTSWDVISDDLTRQIDRNTLLVMDRVWSVDAVAKNRSTSPYGTIVAFSESPITPDLLYVGTDDGLIQVTENGGQTWRKVDNITGVPFRTYVNALYASRHDENTVYATFNHHKYGDFRPYVYKSTDKGVSWQKITGNLPERGSSYAIEEDHVDADLLFVGTEFGVFFTPNGGRQWKQIKAGVPTIAVRDVAIQSRENDLVLGTFGRGFYVLDDYSMLRSLTGDTIAEDAVLYAVRDAWLFEKSRPLGLPRKSFQGDSYYMGENLGPEAIFTYYLKEDMESLKDRRWKRETEEAEAGQNNRYPSYNVLLAEADQTTPGLVFSIRNTAGDVVRKLTAKGKKGVHRIKWDLRYASTDPIQLTPPSFYNPFAGRDEGTLVDPGTYTVTMSRTVNGQELLLHEPVQFEVKALQNTVLPANNRTAKVAFQRQVSELSRSIQGAQRRLTEMTNKLKHIKVAAVRTEVPISNVLSDIQQIESQIKAIQRQLNGDAIAARLDIDQPPTPSTRIGWIMYEQFYSTAAPTKTHMDSYAIALEEFEPMAESIRHLTDVLMPALEKKLEDAGAPYTPGRSIEEEH